MKPYFEDETVILYHGDCLEDKPWLDADVLVTDPPYGIAHVSNFTRNKSKPRIKNPIIGDKSLHARDRALELWGDRPALVFGRWDQPRPAETRHRLVWDMGASVGLGDLAMPWGNSEEEIYVLGKGFLGKRSSNVIQCPRLMGSSKARPDHPTPKPVSLMEALIEKCPPGIIADPFAGSGATLLAARNLGRRVIGMEIEERYCEIIAKRLGQQAFDFTKIGDK